MNGYYHVKVGILVSLLAMILLQLEALSSLVVIKTICVGYVFSLLVDIDHKMSKITWNFIMMSAVSIVFGYFYSETYLVVGMICLVITIFFAKFVPHRGPTHTLWFVLVTPITLLTFGMGWYFYFIGVLAGWSHLWLDGIPFKLSFKSWKGTDWHKNLWRVI